MEPLQHPSEVELAVRSAGFLDHELAAATATLATPGRVIVEGPQEFEPEQRRQILSVTSFLLDRINGPNYGTVFFGAPEEARGTLSHAADKWVEHTQGIARSKTRTKLFEAISGGLGDELYRHAASTRGVLLGGMAVARRIDTVNGPSMEQFVYTATSSQEAIETALATRSAQAMRLVYRGLVALGKREDITHEQELWQARNELFLGYAQKAHHRNNGASVMVNRPFVVTI